MVQPDMPVEKKSPNPLFLVLAVLSAVPTLFFGLAFLVGGLESFLLFLAAGWSAMWTFVWWKMADRYR